MTTTINISKNSIIRIIIIITTIITTTTNISLTKPMEKTVHTTNVPHFLIILILLEAVAVAEEVLFVEAMGLGAVVSGTKTIVAGEVLPIIIVHPVVHSTIITTSNKMVKIIHRMKNVIQSLNLLAGFFGRMVMTKRLISIVKEVVIPTVVLIVEVATVVITVLQQCKSTEIIANVMKESYRKSYTINFSIRI